MTKVRLYLPKEEIKDLVELKSKREIHKLKDVLRLKENDNIFIFNGRGKEFLYRIKEIGRNVLILKKECLIRCQENEEKRIILGFPLMRETKVGFVLQKATELGVFCFIPFFSSRSIIKKLLPAKLERWQKIIIESARQANRLWFPKLEKILNFEDILKLDYRVKIFATKEGHHLDVILNTEISGEILIVVGPEGDFSPQEIEELKRNNFKSLKLSSHILRSETAAIFAVGLIKYILDEG